MAVVGMLRTGMLCFVVLSTHSCGTHDKGEQP